MMRPPRRPKPKAPEFIDGPEDHYQKGQFVFSRDMRSAYQVQSDGSWRKLPADLSKRLIERRVAEDAAKATATAIARLRAEQHIATMEEERGP